MTHKHVSMFKKSANSRGYVQCVISSEYIDEFMGMGFVDNFDRLAKKRITKPKKVETDDSDQG